MSISGLLLGTPPQSEARDVASTEIPSRYESAVQVGAGGMGIVYRAHDKETGEVVALKILRRDVAADPAMQESLRKEVCLARKVTHKNVCRIHEFNRADGQVYISMEFVQGQSLLSSLQQNGRLPWNEAVKIAKQICAGLAEAHAQGIVHRDLKPANIMIDQTGVVKVMDFGIARPAQITVQMTSTMIGTPAYMAPEQVSGRGVDARTDVYAVGLLLYAMVTSSEAFEGNPPLAVALKQLREFPTPAREVVPGLPAHAEAIIVKCIQKDPSKRFQSMDELAAALVAEPQVTANAPARRIAKDLHEFVRAAHRDTSSSVSGLRTSLRQSNWKFLQNRKKRRVLAAGLVGACLVGGIVFAMPGHSHRNQSADSVYLAGAPSVSADQKMKLSRLVPVDAKHSFDMVPTQESTLPTETLGPSISPRAVAADNSKTESGYTRESRKNSQANTVTAKSSRSSLKGSSGPNTRPQLVAVAPASPIATTVVTPPVATPTNSVEAPITVSTPAIANSHESSKQKIEKTFSGIGTVVRSIVPKGGAAESSFQSKSANENSALSETYLEIGIFKDSKSADDVADKLTKLGFHATSTRRNSLWKQSYQVRVGPYTDASAINTAQKEIILDGFNARLIK